MRGVKKKIFRGREMCRFVSPVAVFHRQTIDTRIKKRGEVYEDEKTCNNIAADVPEVSGRN